MIACSADDLQSEEIQERLKDAGFDDYINSPLTT
jgi:hypothetical protein